MSKIGRPMLNDAVRLLRLYLGLSQRDLAYEVKLSQSLISEIETGTKPVTMDVLTAYCDAFDVKPSRMMFFAEEIGEEPVKRRGRLIVAPRILSLLEALAPSEKMDAA